MRDWSIDILKDVWVKLGCFLTGYSYTLIRNSSETSRKTVKKFLSAIILVGTVWSAVGYLFAERYFDANRFQAIVAGFLMFILVIQIERQIILTTSLSFWGKASRVLLGLLMAIIGATVIDQIMFKDDVERYKRDNADNVIEERIATQRESLNNRILDVQSVIDNLSEERDILLKEATARPYINTYVVNKVTEKDSSGATLNEIRDVVTNQVENPKFQLAASKDEQILKREEQKNDLQNSLATLRADQLEELMLESDGFLTELEYLFEILRSRGIALAFYLLWFLLLVLIELLVLITKNGTGSTDYERLIQHQSDINKHAINSLSEKQ
jgi:hypothetical protein